MTQMPCEQWDAETWQSQLEELLALQSVYDEDFRLLAAPGMQQPSAADNGHSGSQGVHAWKHAGNLCLDPEELLMAGPPSEVLVSADGGGRKGDACLGWFIAEALVHVDVPEGGLQLVLEVPPQTAVSAPTVPPPLAPLLKPRQTHALPSDVGTTAADDGSNGGPADGGDKLQMLRNGHEGQGSRDGWATVQAKHSSRGGVKGGGRGRSRGGGVIGIGGAGDQGDAQGGRCSGAMAGRGQFSGRRDSKKTASNGVPSRHSSGVVALANEGSDHSGESCRGRLGNSDSHSGGRGVRGGQGRGRGSPQTSPAGRQGLAAPSALRPQTAEVTSPEGVSNTGDAVVPGPPAERQNESASASGHTAMPAVDGVYLQRVEVSVGEGATWECTKSPPAAVPDADVAGSVEQHQGSEAGTRGEAAELRPAPTRVPFGASVQFLSPIRVTLTLPGGYPATTPPVVELHALWLTTAQTQTIVSELEEQWRVHCVGGAPVLFLWLDWLKSETLHFLGVQQELVLRSWTSATLSADLGAAAAAAGAPEDVAISLMRYSARRDQEKFNMSNVRCSICMEEHLGQRCMRLPECHDVFCAACLSTHARTQLSCGAVDNMRCPAPSCRRQFPPFVLQELLTQAEFERWETLTLQRTLDKMEDLVYCPRCREPCLEDKDHCTLCPGCFFSFCSLCEECWHPGSTCMDPEARLALLEQRRSSVSQAGAVSATERARQEINRVNELKSLALLASTTKQCPMCSMGVEKTEGCNKMTCAYCGAYFCWRCNQVIRGYDHFQQAADGPGGCVLFEQQEIDRWNARWNAAPRVAEVEQRGAVVEWMRQNAREVRICRCVVCGQANVKEGGNNDIRCWSCNSHFCYLCRTWLRSKPGAHFGPGRCRQHSVD